MLQNSIADGYIYGEYRFALEKEDILNLLMGENLYSESDVFVRELLQNAIDTSRFRGFYEIAVCSPSVSTRKTIYSSCVRKLVIQARKA